MKLTDYYTDLHAANRKKALLISFCVHALLLLALFFGVQWKTKNESAKAEDVFWLPESLAQEPPPTAPSNSKKETAPIKNTEPLLPKPPEIVAKAEKKNPEKEKREIRRPPVPKPDFTRDLRQEERQQENLRQQVEKEAAITLKNAERDAAKAAWIDKIRAKIRGNVVLPPALRGNPKVCFKIRLLPTLEVLNVELMQSSGYPVLDTAVERAIAKSSPLPNPESQEHFERNLTLAYCPDEPCPQNPICKQ
ncbi:MAG: TonB C-terminal domain-containing protein [Zoogloeaceae bacterium]|jgi:colicin import membrane protein|nr:TonB C-terminal domain-containing protein [Zoogloeaceae bacterium]